LLIPEERQIPAGRDDLDGRRPGTTLADHDPQPANLNGDRSLMPWIIVLALIAIVALTILSFTLHFLFSPWLLVIIAIVAWIKFRPRRSHR
jgi:hypothetical protein